MAELKKVFTLKANVPSDFDGIPVVNLMQSWFFPYEDKRKPDDIDALWKLAKVCVNSGPSQLDNNIFERCLSIHTIGAPKLTMALFWVNPAEYLPLDSRTISYLDEEDLNISKSKVETLSHYLDIIELAKSKITGNFVDLSRKAYNATALVNVSTESLDNGFQGLLKQTAEANKTSEEMIVKAFMNKEMESGENEITNRINILSRMRNLLNTKPLDLEALQKLCPKLWVLSNDTDSIRRNRFLQSEAAGEAIQSLLAEDDGLPSIDQIDEFFDIAMQNGYQHEGKQDPADAAQFVSALLSAKYPDNFVDFQTNRWNRIFKLIVEQQKRLCQGGTYGWKIQRAGSFASKLSRTPSFIRYFGKEHALWKLAGLAWLFKDGIPEMETKHYWAGGFRWGEESMLDDFVDGNYWQVGYDRDSERESGKRCWELFDQISPDDEFAIKGKRRPGKVREAGLTRLCL